MSSAAPTTGHMASPVRKTWRSAIRTRQSTMPTRMSILRKIRLPCINPSSPHRQGAGQAAACNTIGARRSIYAYIRFLENHKEVTHEACTKRWRVGRRSDVAVIDQVRHKRCEFRSTHIAGMAQATEANIPSHPIDVGEPGASTIMLVVNMTM
jgi:hypothetical protein